MCDTKHARNRSKLTLNQPSEIDGVRISLAKSHSDTRGGFIKFHPGREFENELDSVALSTNFKRGTIRGLHFQVAPFAEEKLISCIQGSVFDVIVDLRPDSKTLGKWTSFELSAENSLQVYLPMGIAHGFQTLEPNAIVHYSLGSLYAPESSYSIDPFGDLGISWPVLDFTISERDKQGISFSSAAKKYSESLKR